MSPRVWTRRIRRSTTLTRAGIHFLLASVVAVVIVVLAAVVISNHVARHETIDNANRSTVSLAEALTPFLTGGLHRQDGDDIARLDAAVRTRVAGTLIVRVKVWSKDGTVLYSDEPSLIGRSFELDPDDLDVLSTGGVESELSDVTRPENAFERGFAPVVEVYAGSRDAEGRAVLVETYFRTEGLDGLQRDLAGRIAPAALLPLGLLLILLLPLAVSLARRVERHERERHALVQLAAEASAAERRRVAGELHDGVIQDLSGVGYALAMVDSRLGRPAAATGAELVELRSTVRTTLDVVRGDVSTLRSMLTTLYAADSDDVDLPNALMALAGEVRAQGLTMLTDFRPLPELPDTVAGALFQVGREAIRNAISHSGATTITVRLSARRSQASGPAEGSPAEVVLEVADDGTGFDQASTHGPAEGHLGLSLIRDAATALGGQLQIASSPGEGTTMTVTVPTLPAAEPRSRWGRGLRSRVVDLRDRAEPQPRPGAQADDGACARPR